MFSLGDEIVKLTNPCLEIFDAEDEINLESSVKRGLSYTQEGDEQVSDLRRKTAPLLEDRDPSYAGKKVSRRSLGHIFQEDDKQSKDDSKISISTDDSLVSGSDDDEEEDEEASTDDDLSDSDVAKFKNLVDSQSNNSFSGDEEPSVDNEISSEEDDDDDDDDKAGDMTQQFSNIDVASEFEKGHAVKNQKEIWSRVVASRIHLQKILTVSNKLPQAPEWGQLKNKGGKDLEENLQKVSQLLKNLMEEYIDLDDDLRSSNPEIENSSGHKKSNSDEEICSDTDEENMEVDLESSPVKIGRKRKLKDYSDVLAKRFESLVPYMNSVVQKFDEKTRLATGRVTQKSFSAFDNSAIKQIEQILQDKPKLIKRTQLKRSFYRVLGKPESEEVQPDENSNIEVLSKQDMLLKDYDPEIFDDDDFYRQILKDVIESKSFGVDTADVRKQLEIQKVRNKMKRKVDTKASKGRKLRFDVHPKNVNFMAPMQICHDTDEERASLMKSLCGGADKSLT